MLMRAVLLMFIFLTLPLCYAADPTELQGRAESGDPEAQLELGTCYMHGKGVEKDPVLAVEWIRKAAEQDYGPAVVAMVYCCDEGVGVEEDLDAATAWYEKALDLGYNRHLEKQEEPEKLSDYTALFAENDARLRTIDPNDPACTNYVEWIETAMESLNELGRRAEIDPWLEELAALGTNNWKLLHAVAMGFDKRTEKYWWNARAALNRYRFRELTLFDRGYRLMMQNPPPATEQAALIKDYVQVILDWRLSYPSRLQIKTIDHDVSKISDSSFWESIPDELVFFDSPESYETATCDGEVLWWLLDHLDSGKESRELISARVAYALCENMVGTASRWHNEVDMDFLASLPDDTLGTRSSGTWKAIPLPHKYAVIPGLIARANEGDSASAQFVAGILESRCQLERAARYYEIAGDTNQVRSIRANQGRLVDCPPFTAGEPIQLDYYYRNGQQAEVSLYHIQVGGNLIERLESNQVYESEVRLLQGNPELFLENRRLDQTNALNLIDSFSLPLDPKPDHRTACEQINLPGLDCGTYLLRVKMQDGNQVDTIINVCEMMLFSFNLLPSDTTTNSQIGLLLCDAATGKPIPDHPLDILQLSDGATRIGGLSDDIDGTYSVKHRTSGVTDAQGIYVFETDISNSEESLIEFYNSSETSSRLLSCAQNSEGQSVVLSPWSIERNRSEPPVQIPFVTTDRPIYRPGDMLHVKLWTGLDRAEGTLAIQNNRYSSLAELAITPDRFGGADADILIPKKTECGTYQIGVKGARTYLEDPRYAFNIEEYRPPEFEVSLDQIEPGIFEIRARYPYGEPVSHARARIKIQTSRSWSSTWYPATDHDEAWERGYWWHGDQFPAFKERQKSRMDAEDFDITVPLQLDFRGCAILDLSDYPGGMNAYEAYGTMTLDVRVEDAANKVVELSERMLNPHQAPQLCGWLDNAFYGPSDEITGHWVSKGSITNIAIELRRIDATTAVPVRQLPVGSPEVSLGRLEPGYYDMRVVAEKRQASEPFRFWVQGNDTQLTEEDPIRLICEKGTYDASETATILIQVDRPGRWVYFFDRVEPEGCHTYPRCIYMEKTSKRIQLPLHGKPGRIACGAVTMARKSLFDATCHLTASDRQADMGRVRITPGKTIYQPGETVKLDLATLDCNGEGKPCSVSLTVYNRMLDDLAHPFRPGIAESFYSLWPDNKYAYCRVNPGWPRPINAITEDWVMEILTRLQWDGSGTELLAGEGSFQSYYVAGDVQFGNSQSFSLFGSAAGGYGPPEQLSIPIRSDFRDDAYWNATIETDENGKASIEFTLPDSLTEWKIVAWAMHTNFAAQGEASIVSRKDFVVQLNTPRFMVEGDELEISGSIRNHTQTNLIVGTDCIVCGTAMLMRPSTGRIATLAARAEKLVYWNLAANIAGTGTVTVVAQNKSVADGMERPIPVLPHSLLKHGARSGVLAGDHREERVIIDIPEAIDPNSLLLEMNATPNMIETVAAALPYLADYPYGCNEQTLNRFLPSLVALETLNQLGIDLNDSTASMPEQRHPIFDRAEVIQRAQAGIDKLEKAQNEYGLWGWTADPDAPRDFMISAWIVRGLGQAAAQEELQVASVHTSVEEFIWKLASMMAPPWHLKHPVEITDEFALLAAVVHEADLSTVIPEGDTSPSIKDLRKYLDRSAPFLMKHADELSLYGKILLAYTFELRGEPGPRDELLRFIDQYLETDPKLGSCWLRMSNRDWWRWYNDDIEALAWYLKLLNRTEPDSAKTAGIARYLLLNRQHGDHWKSTRDTAICIEALCEFIQNNPPKQGENARIELNGHPLSENNRLHPGHNELVVTSPDGAPLFYDATWQYRTHENPITAETSELVSVSRAYYRVDPATGQFSETPLAEGEVLNAGETIRVELTLHAAQKLEYVLAQDFKPAGFECTETASGYRHDNLPHYRELHDERIDCYITHLPKGDSTIAYDLRPEHAGRVAALPARTELMYAPEQAANANEVHLKVVR